MTIFQDIDAALDKQLSVMVGLPPVAWENKSYTPILGTLYLRPTSLPGTSTQSSLGAAGQDSSVGIYQVDVMAKLDTGKKLSTVTADKIADHFKRGTILTYNGRSVRIRSASRKAGRKTGDGWYMVPVEIEYITFTAART